MKQSESIGIIGGYSTIGRIITDYLVRETGFHLLVAGRNARLPENRFENPERICSVRLDYRSEKELDAFCSECMLIINAAGPSLIIEDKIARKALEHNCHYVDIGGYNALYDKLKPYEEEIKSKGLCYVLGAGWMPGISGLLPLYAIQRALSESVEIKHVCLHYGAVEAWSYGSSYDLAASSKISKFSWYKKDGKEIINSMNCSRQVYFPEINRKKTCYPLFDDQLEKCAKELKAESFITYAIMNDFRSTLAYLAVRTLYKNNPEKAARCIQRDSLRLRQKEGSWGLLKCRIEGTCGGAPAFREAKLKVTDNFLPSALPSAVAARRIINGELSPGLDYLCYLTNPEAFLKELSNRGIVYQYNPVLS